MPTAPYDVLETAVNFARTRANDAIQLLSGDTLTDTSVFTLTIINAAWRRVQAILGNYGIPSLDRRVIIPSVPQVTSSDYGSQTYLSWSGFFDGTTLQSSPVLPQDFICPLGLSERPSFGGTIFYPMDKCLKGMPTVVKEALNRRWEWRQDAIYMQGATVATDILLRYAGFLADFVAPGTTAFSAQNIPIMRAASPLAWMIAAEFCKARGDMDAAYLEQKAVDECDFIFNRDIRDERSISKPAERGKLVDPTTPTLGPAGPRGPQKAG